MRKKGTKKRKSMSRRISENPVKAYVYGVPARFLEPDVAALAEGKVFDGHLYQNELASIDIKRREQYREIRGKLSPKLEALEKEYAKAQETYLEARKKLGGRNHRPDIREQLGLAYISKEEFHESDQAKEVRRLKVVRNNLQEELKKERKVVEKKYFSEADKEFKKRKKSILMKHAYEKDPRVRHRPEGMSNKDFETLKRRATNKVGPNTKKYFPLEIRAEMLKEKSWAGAWKEKERCEQKAYEARLKAREDSDLPSGIYQKIEEASNKSCQDSIFKPAHKAYRHKGLVGVQLQKRTRKDTDGNKIRRDLTVAEALSGSDSRLKIQVHPEIRVHGYEKAKRRYEQGKRLEKPPQAAVAIIKLEGRNDKDGTVIRVPFVMHRELPADGVIKWVFLKVDRIGIKPVYSLQFSVEAPSFKIRPLGEGVIAIREGWRLLDDGSVQVAVMDDGKTSTPLILPSDMLKRDEKVSLFLKHADTHFEGKTDEDGCRSVKTVLSDWFKEDPNNLKAAQEALDAWYKRMGRESQNIKTCFPKWKSHGKLAVLAFALCEKYSTPERIKGLWEVWKEERFNHPEKRLDLFKEVGDDSFTLITEWLRKKGVRNPIERVALYLEWWRNKDKHLIGMARAIQHRLKLCRLDTYRKVAHNLSKDYGTVVIGKFNKAKAAKKPKPEDDKRNQREEAANAIRQFVGVSVLEEVLTQKFGKANVIKIPAAKIPKEHYNCGGKIKVPVKGDQIGECSKCENKIDQNANSARQLWVKHCKPGDDGKPKATQKVRRIIASGRPARTRPYSIRQAARRYSQ